VVERGSLRRALRWTPGSSTRDHRPRGRAPRV